MAALKEFYTCKGCSTLVINHNVPLTRKDDKLFYHCPICGTKNSIVCKKEKVGTK